MDQSNHILDSIAEGNLTVSLPLGEVVSKVVGNPEGARAHIKGKSAEGLARKHVLNMLGTPPEMPDAKFAGATVPSQMILTEKPEHRFVIYLSVMGKKPKEIAEDVGFTPEYVRNILAQPWARQQATRLMEESDPQALIAEKLSRAAVGSIETLVEIRDNPKSPESARINAAKDLLDRFLGKPKQQMEITAAPKKADSVEELDQQLRELRARQEGLIGRPKVRVIPDKDFDLPESLEGFA